MIEHCPDQKWIREVFWSPGQIIAAFKDLVRVSFSASTAKIVKARELEKLAGPQFAFAPRIGERSRFLAEEQLRRFVEASIAAELRVLGKGTVRVSSIDDDDEDCNVHAVADERNYRPSEKINPLRSKSIEGQSVYSPNTSTSIYPPVSCTSRHKHERRLRNAGQAAFRQEKTKPGPAGGTAGWGKEAAETGLHVPAEDRAEQSLSSKQRHLPV